MTHVFIPGTKTKARLQEKQRDELFQPAADDGERVIQLDSDSNATTHTTTKKAGSTMEIKLNDKKGRTISLHASDKKKMDAVDKTGTKHTGLKVLGLYTSKGQQFPVVDVAGKPLPVVGERITYWSPVGDVPGVMPAERAPRGSKSGKKGKRASGGITEPVLNILDAVAELANFESVNELLMDDASIQALMEANGVSANEVKRLLEGNKNKPEKRHAETSMFKKMTGFIED